MKYYEIKALPLQFTHKLKLNEHAVLQIANLSNIKFFSYVRPKQ